VTSLGSEDRLAILDLVGRADRLATRRDAVAYAALFAADGFMDGDMGRAVGHEAIARAVADVWAAEPAGTVHLTCNPVIEEAAGGAGVISLLLLATAKPEWSLTGTADVLQRVTRTASGWRIASRAITTPAEPPDDGRGDRGR